MPVRPAITAATRMAIGKEVTAGTAVAATRPLTGQSFTFDVGRELEMNDDQVGFGIPNRSNRRPTPVQNGVVVQHQASLDFVQVLLPFLAGIGMETPSEVLYDADNDGTDDPGEIAHYQWQWSMSQAIPDPVTFTFEYGLSDFGDNWYRNAASGYCQNWKIDSNNQGIASLQATYAARAAQELAAPTSITNYPDFVDAPGLLTKVFVDDTWAGLGTTQIAGQILNASWEYDSHFMHRLYEDGREDLDFSAIRKQKRTNRLNLTAEVSVDDSASFVQDMEDAKRDGEKLFVQMLLQGAVIPPVSPPTNGATPPTQRYAIQLEGCFVQDSGSVRQYGQDGDGNQTIGISLVDLFDVTSQQDMRVTVLTSAASFP